MESGPNREFGKRRPVNIPLASTPPVKRSRHVALLLMGAFAVGGGAYAMMPGGNCAPASAACPPRGAFSGGGYVGSGGVWSRSNFFGGEAASNRSPSGTSVSGTAAGSGSGEVTRGGFGSFARSFAAHFSGGG
jgi:hypothetical protein